MTTTNLNCDTNPGNIVDIELVDKTYIDHAINCLASTLENTIVPAGTILWSAMGTPPNAYLYCDGSEVSRETYSDLFDAIGDLYGAGDGSTTFNLPDLRGRFVRGWDDTGTIDIGRQFGSLQDDQLQGHGHTIRGGSGTESPSLGNNGNVNSKWNYAGARSGVVTNLTTNGHGTPKVGDETRPKNIALLPCIKF
ncbi:phage tail protein [Curvivirga aplysinae]|uniref:phage tail protein n=1 Tax=Curvivirga aplysinae TaxID=2529852 RepID=UPI001F2AB05E|nr:tail fiber protein [Curvivirga aplysinae]